MKRILVQAVAAASIALFLAAPSPAAGTFSDKFKDPATGEIDLSVYLASRAGFVPIPNIITEPAVGYGAALFVVYFHAQRADSALGKRLEPPPEGEHLKLDPPSMSGAGGFGTENGTWGGGVFHFHSWRGDAARYTGALMRASVKLKYYGSGNDPALEEHPIEYTLDGWFLFQKLLMRIKRSNVFVGAQYTFMTLDTAFGSSGDLFNLDGVSKSSKIGGLGLVANYDSRDNIFTPSSGIEAVARWTNYAKLWGSDAKFDKFALCGYGFHGVHPRVVLGLRLTGELATGDVPFYQLPFVNLRGVPAMRYQGEVAGSAEAEVRWNLYKRWSVIGFSGAGAAAQESNELDNSSNVVSGGFGFRYFLARLFGIHAGLDFAWSKDSFAWYIQFGDAWR